MHLNLGSILQGSADERPDHPAVRLGERTVSYAELDRAARGFARDEGARLGERGGRAEGRGGAPQHMADLALEPLVGSVVRDRLAPDGVAAVRGVVADVREHAVRDGLVAGIQRTGERLSEFFPWQEGDRNEIPDRVIVRRE